MHKYKVTVIRHSEGSSHYDQKYELTGRLTIDHGSYIIFDESGKVYYFPITLTILVKID